MRALDELRDKAVSVVERVWAELKAILAKLAVKSYDDYPDGTWLKWLHFGTKPATTHEQKERYAQAGRSGKHCAECMNLNECWLMKPKMPRQPLHENCHCKVEAISRPVAGVTAFAECPISKLTEYALTNKEKKGFFEAAGYGIIDAERIKNEMERQAAAQYAAGRYEVGLLDSYGQRIRTLTVLNFRGERPLRFLSGWLVYPYGRIVNATPLASGQSDEIKKFEEQK